MCMTRFRFVFNVSFWTVVLSLKRDVCCFVLFAAAAAAFSSGALAQPTNNPSPHIISAKVNFANNQISISGENFGSSAPMVTFDGIGLNVVSWSDTAIGRYTVHDTYCRIVCPARHEGRMGCGMFLP